MGHLINSTFFIVATLWQTYHLNLVHYVGEVLIFSLYSSHIFYISFRLKTRQHYVDCFLH